MEIAVSYTHLDVYKRQVLINTIFLTLMFCFPASYNVTQLENLPWRASVCNALMGSCTLPGAPPAAGPPGPPMPAPFLESVNTYPDKYQHIYY